MQHVRGLFGGHFFDVPKLENDSEIWIQFRNCFVQDVVELRLLVAFGWRWAPVLDVAEERIVAGFDFLVCR